MRLTADAAAGRKVTKNTWKGHSTVSNPHFTSGPNNIYLSVKSLYSNKIHNYELSPSLAKEARAVIEMHLYAREVKRCVIQFSILQNCLNIRDIGNVMTYGIKYLWKYDSSGQNKRAKDGNRTRNYQVHTQDRTNKSDVGELFSQTFKHTFTCLNALWTKTSRLA